ncbi:LysR family transcriptional regulator [Roseovarius aquimarinus]|uniref:LysR family transcriptional regulator n=2 Tax=Roseovarius aquimarinus TaxID=1229156 RepID=A0ABW7I6I4_9RHOB
MMLFVKVVDSGSISAASRAMGQTPSAVSKQIGLLEDHVRFRLLSRSRAGVSPTVEGRDFYTRCKAVAAAFEEAAAHIQNLDGIPRGKLRVASSVAFGKSQLIPALPMFLDQNPEVQISLDLTDRDIDIEAEGYDAAICFAEQRQDPDAVLRKFLKSHRILCAAPAYLARAGTPETFGDLPRHNCLRIAGNNDRNDWIGPNGGHGEAACTFEGNSTDVVFRATLAGIGIARLPFYLVASKLRSGELVHLLPDYSQKNAELAVVFADKRNMAPRTRAFVDFLVRTFRGGPEGCTEMAQGTGAGVAERGNAPRPIDHFG